MATTYTWVEDSSSRSATIFRQGKKAESTHIRSWKIFGSDNDELVHADVYRNIFSANTYWQFPNQPQNRLHAQSYTLDYLGDKAWQLEVTYSKDGAEDDSQTNPSRRGRSFDTTGGTQHITQGLSEDRYGVNAPNMKRAIGVDGDNVAGVDIVVPQLTWTETYDVPANYVSNDYVKTLSSLTGTVNNAAFRSFQAGEVLFLGCSGSQQWDSDTGDGPWNLAYKFSASSNQGPGQAFPAITIGELTDIEKDGHDYLWIRYESDVDGATLLKKPKFVYVNQVYRRTNFGALGIGVS